jgi:hypothetical protein
MLIASLGASGAVHGDELRYSLGSIQAERELQLSAGVADVTAILFYNIDGNVPTAVAVSVAEAPAGWRVFLERPGDVGAGAAVVSLVVEPSLPSVASAECKGTSLEAVHLPLRGWICADVVHVRIEVPDSVTEGARGVVRVSAAATWHTGSGVAPFPQEREFVFDVIVGAVQSSQLLQDVPAETSPDAGNRMSLLLIGGVCAGVLLLGVRRALAKSGLVA